MVLFRDVLKKMARVSILLEGVHDILDVCVDEIKRHLDSATNVGLDHAHDDVVENADEDANYRVH
jgi:hypothetical protein